MRRLHEFRKSRNNARLDKTVSWAKSSSETVFIVIDGLKMYQEDRFYFCLMYCNKMSFLLHHQETEL